MMLGVGMIVKMIDIDPNFISIKKIIEVSNFYKRKDGKFYINVRLASSLVLLLFDPVTIQYDSVKFYNTYKADGISKVFNYKNKDYVLKIHK